MTVSRDAWRRELRVGVVALLIVLGPGSAWAGRPLETEDTGTVEPGKAELEVSGDYAKNPADKAWSLKGVLSVGLLPRLEARVESALLLLQPDDESKRGGVADSLLGIKYRLYDEAESRPAILGALTLRLPTGSSRRGLGAEEVDVGILAVASRNFGPVTLTANGGYTFVTRDRRLETWTAAGSLEYRVTSQWSLVGEVVSTLGARRGTDDTLVLRAGSAFAITDRIKLDAAVGFGANRRSPDVLGTLGLTIALF